MAINPFIRPLAYKGRKNQCGRGVEGWTVFYEDNGFRDMFIYGSIAMLAALALPSKKAHAAEIYLCDDGRMLEVNNANRTTTARRDSCVTSWYSARETADIKKSGKTAAGPHMEVAQSSGYQIQTSAIEPLVNAIEVPEGTAMPKTRALREKLAGERRIQREPSRKSAAMSRPRKGLRHMGDGIYAE